MSSDVKKNRIGFDLSRPLKYLGCTIDELALGVSGLVASIVLGGIMGIIAAAVSLGLFFTVKKIKKEISSFRFASFLEWHLGLAKGHSFLPETSKRRFF